jgi:hypothetical protein
MTVCLRCHDPIQSIRKSEVKGGQHLAIKVSICHQAAAAAWSRVRQAQDQIASRLACSSVHIAVQQPRWSLLQDAESTLAASSAPSAASLAAVREDATAPAGAGDALPAHMVLMEGFLLTKKSSTERQEPDAWSRRWFDLISSGSGPTQLRMFHVQPPDSCAPPLVLFSLVNAEISRYDNIAMVWRLLLAVLRRIDLWKLLLRVAVWHCHLENP